jgi:1,2-alpha-glucosylglycerol phosphorylase
VPGLPGAAFWDQEVYNLPAFLFTEPEIARILLIYRHRTLDGARRKAARLGYDGAYYAWISGLTGDELCPDVFFVDVLTGRPIRNHFNVWQMHVAPDVVTTLEPATSRSPATSNSSSTTAPRSCSRWPGSCARSSATTTGAACTTASVCSDPTSGTRTSTTTRSPTTRSRRRCVSPSPPTSGSQANIPRRWPRWQSGSACTDDEVDGLASGARPHRAARSPDPDDGLIEQFAGFFDLEDITPDELRTRLLHPQEYWGWPNGIAVRTQVSKQADIAMLLWLHRDRFDVETARANYEYYEPRCSHDSSLSHAAHGMVAVGIGDAERAHGHFRRTATVDLLNTQHAVVGGTFIGGIHTAACGGTQQLAVQGFGGLSFADGRLQIDPLLPSAWTGLRYPITWRGADLRVHITRTEAATAVTIEAAAANAAPVELDVVGQLVSVAPGATVTVG